jgi:hypothetical protein
MADSFACSTLDTCLEGTAALVRMIVSTLKASLCRGTVLSISSARAKSSYTSSRRAVSFLFQPVNLGAVTLDKIKGVVRIKAIRPCLVRGRGTVDPGSMEFAKSVFGVVVH